MSINQIIDIKDSLVIMHNVEFSTTKEGKILLKVPRFKSEKFRKIFGFALRRHFHEILLDYEGSEFWKLVDGETNITDIVKKLSKILNEDYEETFSKTKLYLKVMLKYKYIKIK